MARLSRSSKTNLITRARAGDMAAQAIIDLENSGGGLQGVKGAGAGTGGVATVTLNVASQVSGAVDVALTVFAPSAGDGTFGDISQGSFVVVENTSEHSHRCWAKTNASGVLTFTLESATTGTFLVQAICAGKGAQTLGGGLACLFTVVFS